MIKFEVTISDLPALSYALNKGIEGIETAMTTAAKHDMSERTAQQLKRHLDALNGLKAQLEEGKVV